MYILVRRLLHGILIVVAILEEAELVPQEGQ